MSNLVQRNLAGSSPRSASASTRHPGSTTGEVVVVGAGIVGACTALQLQRGGARVTLLDPLPPGSETSYGNAGLVSVDSCIPISLPGMVWQVPGWLMDTDGPLAIRPAHLPAAMPWLLKWLWAGRRESVLRASVLLHELHRPALKEYRSLLGEDAFADLIKLTGQLHLWGKNGKPSAADRLVGEIRQRQGIHVTGLDAEALAQRVPALTKDLKQGISFDNHAFCINPQRLAQTLVRRFQEFGGELMHEKVQRIEALDGGRWRLWTNAASREAEQVVVAAGAYSKDLLAPLKVALPLEVERGYHVELPDPGVTLGLPFIDKDRAVAVTPMENGLRFAGTVEFAGLRHPANPQRIDALLKAAKAMFPGIRTNGAKTWLGFRPSTPDSVPIVGPVAGCPGLILACGHGHTGMTGAPMTARLVAHHVLGTPVEVNPQGYRLERFS